eukprot:760962-Hanusia_phi.AAC.8
MGVHGLRDGGPLGRVVGWKQLVGGRPPYWSRGGAGAVNYGGGSGLIGLPPNKGNVLEGADRYFARGTRVGILIGTMGDHAGVGPSKIGLFRGWGGVKLGPYPSSDTPPPRRLSPTAHSLPDLEASRFRGGGGV